jgi:hypothetical protein
MQTFRLAGFAIFLIASLSSFAEAAGEGPDGHPDENAAGPGKGKGKGCKGGKGGKGSRRLTESEESDSSEEWSFSNHTEEMKSLEVEECDEEGLPVGKIIAIVGGVLGLIVCIAGLWLYICCRGGVQKKAVNVSSSTTGAPWEGAENVVGHQIEEGHVQTDKAVDGIVDGWIPQHIVNKANEV